VLGEERPLAKLLANRQKKGRTRHPLVSRLVVS